MKYCFELCLILWSIRAASAQISYPELLTSQFEDSPSPSGLYSTLLQSRPDTNLLPGVSWEVKDELTVHVNKGRQGLVEDIHASGSLLRLRANLGNSSRCPQLVLSRRTLETGLVDNDGGKALHFRGHLYQPEIRLDWPVTHRMLAYAGYRETSYAADGTTHLYDGIFTIFPTTPPFRYQGRERLALVGLQLPLSRTWSFEAVAGRKEEPSRIQLSETGDATRLTLPFGNTGLTGLIAIRRRLSDRTSLLAYLGGESLRGIRAVERESSRDVGSAETTQREESLGLGFQREFGAHRTLSFFLESSREHWRTQGFVPDPRLLQTGYSLTSNLHYGASYAISKDGLGMRWSQIGSSGQELHIAARLLQVSLRGDANYDVRFFGLLKTGRTTYRQDRLQVLLLQSRYIYPVKSFRIGMEASQLIPLRSGGGPGGGGGASDNADHRVTSGGWMLNCRVERLF